MIRPRTRLIIALMIGLLWIGLNFILYRFTIMTGFGLRYVLLPLIIILWVFWLGVRYTRATYQLKSVSQALKYLMACLFGVNIPILVIGDGKAFVGEDEENLVLKIGGPGYLVIRPGNVALVENYSGNVKVLGPGAHFLTRYETVKDFTSLDERYRHIEILTARSKDGIEVTAQDIRYRYRIASQSSAAETSSQAATNLFEYSEEAIIRMVYNRMQGSTGVGSWEEGVNGIVESIIADHIREHLVDYLTAPRSQGIDPRAEIYAEFYSPAGKSKFFNRGAELIWIDIGHFETAEKTVAMQRVSTWQARWQGNVNMLRDFATVQDLGRAEAQRDIVIAIEQALRPIIQPGESRQAIRTRILARISQLTDALEDQTGFTQNS